MWENFDFEIWAMKLGLLLYLVAIPATALAQGSIAGRVTDSAGVAVSGVAVEAISDALIETKRTTTTDGAGQYRIEELRPGSYRVQLTGAGWKPLQRERVEVTGPLTAIVNAQLTVDAGTETITVNSAPPIIDVRSAKRAITHSGGVVASIPTARSYNALLTLVPGVVTSGNDLVTGPAATAFPAKADPADPNLVKVVTDLRGHALYFSRSPIPFRREPNSGPAQAYYLHLGVYAYRWQFLQDFTSWSPSPLELTEKLEQLRALEHGRSIYVLKVDRATHGIDTPEQYAAFVKRHKERN